MQAIVAELRLNRIKTLYKVGLLKEGCHSGGIHDTLGDTVAIAAAKEDSNGKKC